MADPYAGTGDSLSSPAQHATPITPSDSADLPTVTKSIYVGVSGDISMILAGDTNAVLFKAVPVGILPVRVRRVQNSGTGASNLLALT